MTFTPPDSLAGSVDLDTTDVEVNFKRRVANCVAKHVKKKVACMFWTIIILLFIMTIAIVGVGYMLYNVQVTVVVHHNTTFIKNTTEQCPVMEPVTEPFTNTTSEQWPVTDSTTTDLTRTEQTYLLGVLVIPVMSSVAVSGLFGY